MANVNVNWSLCVISLLFTTRAAQNWIQHGPGHLRFRTQSSPQSGGLFIIHMCCS